MLTCDDFVKFLKKSQFDDSRDKATIIVVEEAKDVIVMEKTNRYHGLYHVLNGAISPSNGIGPDDINIKQLLKAISANAFRQMIALIRSDH